MADTTVPADNGCEPALAAARQMYSLADDIAPKNPEAAEKLRDQATNICNIVMGFERLRNAVWPGLPAFVPTEEKPQEDFYIIVAEGLRDCFDQHAGLVEALKGLLQLGMPNSHPAVTAALEVIKRAEAE